MDSAWSAALLCLQRFAYYRPEDFRRFTFLSSLEKLNEQNLSRYRTFRNHQMVASAKPFNVSGRSEIFSERGYFGISPHS